jgi:hypothetical protein
MIVMSQSHAARQRAVASGAVPLVVREVFSVPRCRSAERLLDRVAGS